MSDVLIPVATLKWWRELLDINPQDVAPRIDAYLRPGSNPPPTFPKPEPPANPPEARYTLTDLGRAYVAALKGGE